MSEKAVLECSRNEHPKYRVEFILELKNKRTLVAEDKSDDMYVAIASAASKTVNQIKKEKVRHFGLSN